MSPAQFQEEPFPSLLPQELCQKRRSFGSSVLDGLRSLSKESQHLKSPEEPTAPMVNPPQKSGEKKKVLKKITGRRIDGKTSLDGVVLQEAAKIHLLLVWDGILSQENCPREGGRPYRFLRVGKPPASGWDPRGAIPSPAWLSSRC